MGPKIRQVRDPQGYVLRCVLLQVLERDEKGRPTKSRLFYEDEKVDIAQAVAEGKQVEFLTVWVGEALLRGKGVRKDASVTSDQTGADVRATLRR